MGTKTYTWIKIAENPGEISFNEHDLVEMEVEGKKICLAKFQEKISACVHSCPHAGGILSEGYLDPVGNLVCPVHRYKFNMSNGRNVSGEGYFLKTFPVELREDGLYIGFEEKKGLFSWLK